MKVNNITARIRQMRSRFRDRFWTKPKSQMLTVPSEGFSSSYQDTKTAIKELSKIAQENTDAVGVYLALGNLYRAQGDIERAIKIRQSLIHRPSLPSAVKERALYELGVDYRRAGFYGRARNTFEQLRQNLGSEPALMEALGALSAAENDYKQAALYFETLDKPIPIAHYYVQAAKNCLEEGDKESYEQNIKKALRVYPASVEAWLEKIVQAYANSSWKSFSRDSRKALSKIDPKLRFLLLEGFIQHLIKAKGEKEIFTPLLSSRAGGILLEVLADYPEDILLRYYGAWLHLHTEDKPKAKESLKQCLQMDEEFWPARIVLMSLSLESQSITAETRSQLEFFLDQIGKSKKFFCSHCGLKRKHIFFVCPRCRSWHSIDFIRIFPD